MDLYKIGQSHKQVDCNIDNSEKRSPKPSIEASLSQHMSKRLNTLSTTNKFMDLAQEKSGECDDTTSCVSHGNNKHLRTEEKVPRMSTVLNASLSERNTAASNAAELRDSIHESDDFATQLHEQIQKFTNFWEVTTSPKTYTPFHSPKASLAHDDDDDDYVSAASDHTGKILQQSTFAMDKIEKSKNATVFSEKKRKRRSFQLYKRNSTNTINSVYVKGKKKEMMWYDSSFLCHNRSRFSAPFPYSNQMLEAAHKPVSIGLRTGLKSSPQNSISPPKLIPYSVDQVFKQDYPLIPFEDPECLARVTSLTSEPLSATLRMLGACREHATRSYTFGLLQSNNNYLAQRENDNWEHNHPSDHNLGDMPFSSSTHLEAIDKHDEYHVKDMTKGELTNHPKLQEATSPAGNRVILTHCKPAPPLISTDNDNLIASEDRKAFLASLGHCKNMALGNSMSSSNLFIRRRCSSDVGIDSVRSSIATPSIISCGKRSRKSRPRLESTLRAAPFRITAQNWSHPISSDTMSSDESNSTCDSFHKHIMRHTQIPFRSSGRPKHNLSPSRCSSSLDPQQSPVAISPSPPLPAYNPSVTAVSSSSSSSSSSSHSSPWTRTTAKSKERIPAGADRVSRLSGVSKANSKRSSSVLRDFGKHGSKRASLNQNNTSIFSSENLQQQGLSSSYSHSPSLMHQNMVVNGTQAPMELQAKFGKENSISIDKLGETIFFRNGNHLHEGNNSEYIKQVGSVLNNGMRKSYTQPSLSHPQENYSRRYDYSNCTNSSNHTQTHTQHADHRHDEQVSINMSCTPISSYRNGINGGTPFSALSLPASPFYRQDIASGKFPGNNYDKRKKIVRVFIFIVIAVTVAALISNIVVLHLRLQMAFSKLDKVQQAQHVNQNYMLKGSLETLLPGLSGKESPEDPSSSTPAALSSRSLAALKFKRVPSKCKISVTAPTSYGSALSITSTADSEAQKTLTSTSFKSISTAQNDVSVGTSSTSVALHLPGTTNAVSLHEGPVNSAAGLSQ